MGRDGPLAPAHARAFRGGRFRGREGRRALPALPTFVIGGAPKSGTTALWASLDAHPEVWMSRMKEPRFLTRPAPVRLSGSRLTSLGR
jgi:hypothetical protein